MLQSKTRHVLGFVAGIALMLTFAACAPVQPAPAADVEDLSGEEALSGRVSVYAAASLTEAFTELGEQFTAAHPGVQVEFNFAGSQQLVQQLGGGAPGDVFASANVRQMEAAVETGRVEAGSPQIFVRNRLVVITPLDNPAGITALQDLAQPGLKLIFAAREVPVGGYTLDFLAKASAAPDFTATYSETVVANVVSYEENVRAVLSKVVLGEADAGVVYSSDIVGAAADQVARIDIPDALNTVAEYPIAPLADAENSAAAQAFIDLVLSPEGQSVLAEYGFIPVAE